MIDRKKLAEQLTDCFDDARKEYAEHNAVDNARNSALEAIDAQIQQAELKLTNAPSANEASYIFAISGRTDYTQEETNAALSRYKSHVAQKAIMNVAKASKVRLESTMTSHERDIADLRDLRSTVEKTYSAQDFGNMSDGAVAAVKAEYQSFADGNGQDALTALSYLGTQA